MAALAEDLGLDEATGYRYRQTDQLLGLTGYLRAGQSELAHQRPTRQPAPGTRPGALSRCRAIADWLAATYGVRCSVSGLTDRLHRLGADALGALSCKRTTAVPCQADAAAQTAILTDLLAPLLKVAKAGKAVAYFAGAAHPTHNPRATHVWTETGKNGPCSPSTAVNGSIATPPSTPAAPPRSTSTRPAASTPKAPNASVKK